MLFTWLSKRPARHIRPAVSSIARFESLESRELLTISPDEQLFVYLLNRARHDPVAYQQEQNLNIDLSNVPAAQPLAVNDDLFDSAEFHSNEMATHNYFGHQSQVTGDWPNKMVRDQGYDLPAAWTSNANYVESLAAGTVIDTPIEAMNLLIVDQGVPSLGHRIHLLSIGASHADDHEIGVGHSYNAGSTYSNYWAIHITHQESPGLFLTGVVFTDTNHNGRYDLNEGLSGVTVSTGALNTTTNAAGGWSINVGTAGTYTVTASGGALTVASSAQLTLTDKNREIDFINGLTDGIIDFASVPAGPPQAPVLTLTAATFTAAKGKPVVLGGGAIITDPDSPNYNGGNLSIQIAAGAASGDQLTIQKQGKRAGQINLLGNEVRSGKTTIGTFSGGASGTALTISFNSHATLQDVQNVLRNVAFHTLKRGATTGTRTISFTLTDDTSLRSNSPTRTVNV
ncbi:MAG: hypothetical protein U0903_22740 [Planctomycetales bacterium]